MVMVQTHSSKHKEKVTLILHNNDKIIKHKVGLLNLAEELGNVSKACQIMGLSRDTFYRYRDTVEDGRVEALLEQPLLFPRHLSSERNIGELFEVETIPYHQVVHIDLSPMQVQGLEGSPELSMSGCVSIEKSDREHMSGRV